MAQTGVCNLEELLNTFVEVRPSLRESVFRWLSDRNDPDQWELRGHWSWHRHLGKRDDGRQRLRLAANSLVAPGLGPIVDIPTLTPLSNGNYVVNFFGYNGDEGAVTWANGTTGITGIVSAANSLVGSNFGDYVGGNGGSSGGVTALPNGNYVVDSPFWNKTRARRRGGTGRRASQAPFPPPTASSWAALEGISETLI